MTDQETLVRTFDVEVVEGDGRTIDAKLVPYGVQAKVADHGGPVYTEEFASGAFKGQEAAANRVLLNFEHQPGIGGVVGRGLTLTDNPDGLHGSFRMLDAQDADKALELVNAGVLRGLSVEFVALKSRTVNGVTQRLRAHLDKVSLCRSPAYPDAQVVAVRETPPVAAQTLPGASTEILDRLASRGVVPVVVDGVTRKPWDGSRDRFTDDEYARSCLIGDSFPVLEPDGAVNANALAAVAAKITSGGTITPLANRVIVARQLVRLYRQAQIETPAPIKALARK